MPKVELLVNGKIGRGNKNDATDVDNTEYGAVAERALRTGPHTLANCPYERKGSSSSSAGNHR